MIFYKQLSATLCDACGGLPFGNAKGERLRNLWSEARSHFMLVVGLKITQLKMETIRQIVQVKSDRKIEITLPDTVAPGLIEVVIVLQPITSVNSPKDSLSKTLREPSEPLDLFGFLQQRVDPLQFQEQLRNEWGE